MNRSRLRHTDGRGKAPGGQRAGKRGLVRVILVSKTSKCLSHFLRHLEIRNCWYGIAGSYDEARSLIRKAGCDLLVGVTPLPQGVVASVASTIAARRSSFFYAQPVEEGCWWVPVYLRGELCFGTPALRPKEFVRFLDTLVDEIRSAQAEPHTSGHVATALALAAG